MREVNLAAGCDTVEKERGLGRLQRVPPHVRHARSLEPPAPAWKQAEPVEAGRFVAAFEEPLHAEADPEERAAIIDEPQETVSPLGAERCRRAEMADARHDDGAGRVDFARMRDAPHAAADGDERLLDRLQVADAVID